MTVAFSQMVSKNTAALWGHLPGNLSWEEQWFQPVWGDSDSQGKNTLMNVCSYSNAHPIHTLPNTVALLGLTLNLL